MPFTVIKHEVDPKEKLLQELGDISDVEVFGNQVLIAVYTRPVEAKTIGGIMLPGSINDADKFQSKTGLVVKMGPDAFYDPNGKWFKGISIKDHDWVISRPADGWSLTINNVLCRLVDDVNIKMRAPDADRVY
jgi:co-chaperonin GroES (HSP10)